MKIEIKITDDAGIIRQYTLDSSLPTKDIPLVLWTNAHSKDANNWDFYPNENVAVRECSPLSSTHCYVHESLLKGMNVNF